jgi:hypothetical protein
MGTCLSKKDMAICLVFFNPASTKRILMNYLFVVNQFELQDLPVFTMELVFEGRKPEIADAFHVKADSFMFHKERLCRLLEKKIPREFTKLAFLDADIVFSNPDWYKITSHFLERYDVVQPFEKCHWLDLTYSENTLTRETVLKMTDKVYNTKYHPGFAWCFRRDWYNKTGFFDWAVTGSGDALSCAAWLKKTFPPNFKSCPSAIKHEFLKFYYNDSPRITFLRGFEVSHLYHGARVNRQYVSRHELLEVDERISQLVRLNSDGVYEWIDKDKWNPLFLKYFKSRNDDDLSEDLKLNSNTVLTS